MTTGLRLDLLLLECVSVVVKSVPNGATVWDGGGRDLAAAKLKELGVSDQSLTVVDVARAVGILRPDPNVIDVKPNGQNRKRRVPRV